MYTYNIHLCPELRFSTLGVPHLRRLLADKIHNTKLENLHVRCFIHRRVVVLP